jgi:hypothetical protein
MELVSWLVGWLVSQLVSLVIYLLLYRLSTTYICFKVKSTQKHNIITFTVFLCGFDGDDWFAQLHDVAFFSHWTLNNGIAVIGTPPSFIAVYKYKLFLILRTESGDVPARWLVLLLCVRTGTEFESRTCSGFQVTNAL